MKDCKTHVDFELIKMCRLSIYSVQKLKGKKLWPWNQFGNTNEIILIKDLVQRKKYTEVYVLQKNTT